MMETTSISTSNYSLNYECDPWVKENFYNFFLEKLLTSGFNLFYRLGVSRSSFINIKIKDTEMSINLFDCLVSFKNSFSVYGSNGSLKLGLLGSKQIYGISPSVLIFAIDNGTEISKACHIFDKILFEAFSNIDLYYSEFLEGFDESRAVRQGSFKVYSGNIQ